MFTDLVVTGPRLVTSSRARWRIDRKGAAAGGEVSCARKELDVNTPNSIFNRVTLVLEHAVKLIRSKIFEFHSKREM